jgi:hypothetical protein
MITSASTGPARKATRQPQLVATWFRTNRVTMVPRNAPAQ